MQASPYPKNSCVWWDRQAQHIGPEPLLTHSTWVYRLASIWFASRPIFFVLLVFSDEIDACNELENLATRSMSIGARCKFMHSSMTSVSFRNGDSVVSGIGTRLYDSLSAASTGEEHCAPRCDCTFDDATGYRNRTTVHNSVFSAAAAATACIPMTLHS